MKIYNINVKSLIFVIFLISLLIILFIGTMALINSSTIVMNNENFTKVLKECHDDPYTYINKRIICSGYVFRGQDFAKNQFVVARDMLINESESRIVGFLCEFENANEFENNEWVSISGSLFVGDYHGAMPIIKINTITPITTPNDIFVYPPS